VLLYDASTTYVIGGGGLSAIGITCRFVRSGLELTRIAESWCKHWCKPFGWGTAIPAGGYFLFLGSVIGVGDEIWKTLDSA
jgi:hypothetical protein